MYSVSLVVPSTMSIISIILFYDRAIDVEDILLTRVLVGNVLLAFYMRFDLNFKVLYLRLS